MLKWLQEAKPLVPPQSLTGKALAYLTMLFRDLPHAHRVEDYERPLPTRWTNERVRESLAQSTVPV